ncbi:BrnA antitoxin family protein [Sphingomonas aerolata]|uniref:BrnA antitoxin family protein n=1 Tax=Sphingomonas aerolata TaxID=185951 RepID=UPI003346CC4F
MVRLDPDVRAKFRKGGPGWQGRSNAAVRAAAGLQGNSAGREGRQGSRSFRWSGRDRNDRVASSLRA